MARLTPARLTLASPLPVLRRRRVTFSPARVRLRPRVNGRLVRGRGGRGGCGLAAGYRDRLSLSPSRTVTGPRLCLPAGDGAVPRWAALQVLSHVGQFFPLRIVPVTPGRSLACHQFFIIRHHRKDCDQIGPSSSRSRSRSRSQLLVLQCTRVRPNFRELPIPFPDKKKVHFQIIQLFKIRRGRRTVAQRMRRTG